MLLIEVPPLRVEKRLALVSYSVAGDGVGEIDCYIQPPTAVAAGSALRAMREARGLYMGDAARRTGLRVVDVSALETGRKTFATDADAAAYSVAINAEVL